MTAAPARRHYDLQVETALHVIICEFEDTYEEFLEAIIELDEDDTHRGLIVADIEEQNAQRR